MVLAVCDRQHTHVLLFQNYFCLLGLSQIQDTIQTVNISFVVQSLNQFSMSRVNTLRPRQNGRHFADDMFKCIFLNENVWIPIEISLTFVPKGPINNIPALVQIMGWHRPGAKPLSEAMMVNLSTHISVSRPQWVNIWPEVDSRDLRKFYCCGIGC